MISLVHADTIILNNGRELKGTVISETDKEVVLYLKSGNITLEKSTIKEIKKGGNESMGSDKKGTTAAASQSSKSYSSAKIEDTGKMGINELIAKLEQINLESWEHESHKVTEPESGNYKVLRSNGNTEMINDMPKSPDGIDKLWVKRSIERVDTGHFIIYYPGVTGSSWRMLYWSEKGRAWTEEHPNLNAYRNMKNLSNELFKKILVAGGGNSGDLAAIQSAASTIRDSKIMKAEAVEKANNTIEEIVNRAGRSWGGAEILRQIISLDYSQDKPSQEEMIRIAKEKRDLLIKVARRLK